MVPLHYFYEMKTATGTNLSKIDNEILPLLEKAIVDSILQEVFPDKCKSTAIGKRQLRESRNKRHLEIVGVSMYPPDYVTVHSCDALASSNNAGDCFVVKGELSMFTEDDQVVSEKARIENLIREHMNSGVFNTLSSEIIKLYYLNGSPDTKESNIEDNDGVNGIEGTTKGTNKGLKVGLIVGFGALAAILAGVVFRITRRRGNNDDQTEIQEGGAQTYLDVNEQRTSFS